MSTAVWHARVGRALRFVSLGLCLLPGGCMPRTFAPSLDELAEAYVRVSLQLAQHQPTLVESWIGSSALLPGPRVPVMELKVVVDDLLATAERLRTGQLDPTERPRLEYLQGQLRALTLVTRRLLGESPPFAEEAQAGFGRALPAPDVEAIEAARSQLDAELGGEGSLATRHAAFRRQFLVPVPRVDHVVRASVDACRTATAQHVVLPADERVAVSFDESIAWGAHAQYRGRHETSVRIGAVHGHDVAALLHMACHETYGGHHAQHVLIDDALVKGRGWMEFQLTPAFGPHRLISEGAAEVGVDLALPEDARATLYETRLLALAGLPSRDAKRLARVETLASRLEASIPVVLARYLDNDASADATRGRLASDALLVSPDRFLAFAERHRTGAVAYPVGKTVVSEWVGRAATDDQRWRRLLDLFTRTPFTVN